MIGNYSGDFEMISDIVTGEHNQTTAVRFENFEHYESYFNSFDKDYVADDTNITSIFNKLNTHKCNKS